MTFEKAEMEKNLRNGLIWISQPQMVGFCNLVGVGIAPVSKITSVKIGQNIPFARNVYNIVLKLKNILLYHT